MSVEIAWKQNILVTDFHLLKSLLVVLGFGSQAFVCGFSRQNINSARERQTTPSRACYSLLACTKRARVRSGQVIFMIIIRRQSTLSHDLDH